MGLKKNFCRVSKKCPRYLQREKGGYLWFNSLSEWRRSRYTEGILGLSVVVCIRLYRDNRIENEQYKEGRVEKRSP
jgi:hypothetical protein